MIELGLIGLPISASLSPALHHAAAQACGLAVHYALYPTPADAVASTLTALQSAGVRGVNVTAPHKSAVAALVDELGPTAQRLGVVNTVVFEPDGTRWGGNTDLAGVAWALGPVRGASAVVLGAGGAARAVVAALADGGAQAIRIVARQPAAAQALADDLGGPTATAWALTDLRAALSQAQLLVTCLPASAVNVVLNAPLGEMADAAHLMDLGYGSSAQQIVRYAEGFGLVAQDGLGMLTAQGVAAFERWTNQRPPVEAVLLELRQAQQQARVECRTSDDLASPNARGD